MNINETFQDQKKFEFLFESVQHGNSSDKIRINLTKSSERLKAVLIHRSLFQKKRHDT